MVAAVITKHHSVRTLRVAAGIASVCILAFASADAIIINAGLTKSDPRATGVEARSSPSKPIASTPASAGT